MDSADDLRKRALAAAAKERADSQARWERYAQERQRRYDALQVEVAKKLQDSLGVPSSPADWEHKSEIVHSYDGDPSTIQWFTTMVQGVEIKVTITRGPGDELTLGHVPSLLDFGRVLEQGKTSYTGN